MAYDLPRPHMGPRASMSSFASESPSSRMGRGSMANFSEFNSSSAALNPLGPYRDDATNAGSYSMAEIPRSPGPDAAEKQFYLPATKQRSRKKTMWLIAAAVLLIIAVAAVCVYVFVIRPKNSSGSSSTGGVSTGDPTKPTPTSTPDAVPTSGGDGSIITMEDGTTFVYRNPFGGYWVDDPSNPFNNGARPQSWSPALNETFRYGVDRIRGVNFGGWLNTEPFIAPALYEKYANNPVPPVDEWNLALAMRADTAGGGINQLEEHYKTFITEKDMADLAGAGLNYVRIPIGYWAIETREGEPYLAKVSWQYLLKAIKWARKYGIRINLDLHGVPGTQNRWEHSGRRGTVGWMHGPMGYANAQRSLDYIRIIAQFISQPQYKDVVTMFCIVNEPFGPDIEIENLQSFYAEAYRIIRGVTGIGEGKGPWISIGDGFFPRDRWAGFMQGADRITLDSHPYRSFGTPRAESMAAQTRAPCTEWARSVNESMNAFGLSNAGEFSNAVTDCTLFLNGVGEGIRYEGTHSLSGPGSRVGSCEPWRNYRNWDAAMKQSVMDYALASMDALQNFFFWTWRIGPSLQYQDIVGPEWSYSLGLENGWMPKDPRAAVGFCGDNSLPVNPLPAWHTGGAGAGQLASTIAFPPPASRTLPAYTQTGPVPTLPAPTYTAVSGGATTTADAGNGWANAADQLGMAVPIPTCSYLDPWVNADTLAPPACGQPAVRRDLEPAGPTFAP